MTEVIISEMPLTRLQDRIGIIRQGLLNFPAARFEKYVAAMRSFNIVVKGTENLKQIPGPVMFASNHLRPPNPLDFAPDVFVLFHVIREHTGKQIHVIANRNLSLLLPSCLTTPVIRFVYSCIPWVIPVDTKNKRREDLTNFLKTVNAVIKSGSSLLIFSAGFAEMKYNPKTPLHPGVAHIAWGNKVDIVPVYINNAKMLNPKTNGPVLVTFGPPISPRQGKVEIMIQLQDSIHELHTTYGIPFEKHLREGRPFTLAVAATIQSSDP